jgi:prepilin-type N-terminal cleavage/methylation domain-containing protein
MKKITLPKSGFTLLELLVASAVSSIILGAVAAGVYALQRSFIGNKAYMKASADSARVIDYITQDLRNATAVSRRTAGVSTRFEEKDFEITANDQLCVFVPDYYLSNIPDNTSGSTYKTARFSRAALPAGRTYFDYKDIVTINGTTRVVNYPSSLEVRYSKQPRSAADQTVCFFRMEFEGGTLRKADEISEKAGNLQVTVQAVDAWNFQITSSFSSYWSGEKYRKSSRQFSTVHLENHRLDLVK